MANYVVKTSQLFVSILSISMLLVVSVFIAYGALLYLELPEIRLNSKNECVRVVSFKNGESYQCQDKDLVLRKYRIVQE